MAQTVSQEVAGLDLTIPTPASGINRNAAIRSYRNTFDTSSVASTTSDTLSLGVIPEGCRVRAFDIAASVNMSAASIAIGTAADPDKYLAAGALPNATSARRQVLPSAAGYDALTAEEELIVTISGATIPDGLLCIDVEAAKR